MGRKLELQVALDCLRVEEALRLMEQVHPYADIVEIGTPLIFEAGLATVEQIKSRYPDKTYVADLKIMDAGGIEASSGFARGADIVTILGVAADVTVQAALEAAADHGGKVMADLINAPDPVCRCRELDALDVPILCLHTAFDRQGAIRADAQPLAEVRRQTACRLAVAGGVTLGTMPAVIKAGADVVIVGGAIARDPNPGEAAAAMKKLIETLAARGASHAGGVTRPGAVSVTRGRSRSAVP